MKLKKTLLQMFILLCVLNSSIFAANYQKVQDISGDVDEAIAYLLISQGKTPGGETLPYSNAEIISMLERIDMNNLSDYELDIYNYISEIAYEEPNRTAKNMGLTWSGDVALELYAHSNTDTSNVGRANWIRGWNDMEPTFKLNLETWPSDSFYGFGEISLGNSYYVGKDKGDLVNTTDFGNNTLSTNILMLTDPTTLIANDLDFGVPYRAFVAMGGDNWTVQTGREQLSWGNGVSGNMAIGDQVTYHNMARYSAYSDIYKYTFLTSFFPHPSQYYDSDLNGIQTLDKFQNQSDSKTGLKMYMAHRLEFNILENLNLTVTESIMYQSIDNTIDLSILNPAAIYHDYYIRNNSNSLLTLEMNYTPIKHINVYGQLAVDEFALPGEPTSGNNSYPQALGLMLGVKAMYPVEDGFAYGSIEGVKTDPYLYLRYGEETDTAILNDDGDTFTKGTTEYDINYVVAIRNWSDGVSYDESFIGYKYGNDALVLNINGGLKKFNKYSVEGNIFYMAHGTFDMWTVWEKGDSPSTPTTSGNGLYNKNGNTGKDAVEHTIVVGVNGNYELNSNTNAYAQLDYIHKTNSGNISGVSYNDVQLTVGTKYKF